MNKHQFNKWLLEDYNIEAHAWYNNRSESAKRALKSKWYAGLKRFQIGYLLQAGEEILSLDEDKPKFPDDHLQTLVYKCHKLEPRPNNIPVITPPTEEEKKELLAVTKKCRQIVLESAGRTEAPKPGPEDEKPTNVSSESGTTPKKPAQSEFEALKQVPWKEPDGKPVDWKAMKADVDRLAETDDIPF